MNYEDSITADVVANSLSRCQTQGGKSGRQTLLCPSSAGPNLRGERKTVARSVVNDSIAARVVLRQFFNLVFSGFKSFYRFNPIRAVFTKPKNIKSIFHLYHLETIRAEIGFLGGLRSSLECLTREVVNLRMAALNGRKHFGVQ